MSSTLTGIDHPPSEWNWTPTNIVQGGAFFLEKKLEGVQYHFLEMDNLIEWKARHKNFQTFVKKSIDECKILHHAAMHILQTKSDITINANAIQGIASAALACQQYLEKQQEQVTSSFILKKNLVSCTDSLIRKGIFALSIGTLVYSRKIIPAWGVFVITGSTYLIIKNTVRLVRKFTTAGQEKAKIASEFSDMEKNIKSQLELHLKASV